MSKKTEEAAQAIEAAAEEEPKKEFIKPEDLLSTGSTLLNLACADNPHGGLPKGKYSLLVGDSAAGKTFLSMTCFAEACINPNFQDHRLIYDNAEDGCMIDIERFFGKAVADKIEPPGEDKEGASYSETIEDFYYNIDNAIKEEEPFIYVLDSMDSLSSEYEGKKFDQGKKAADKTVSEDDNAEETKVKGSYGDGKAKQNSTNIRRLLAPLRKSGSILLILCQTRDNYTGYGGKVRSGGHALRFYATLEIWFSIKEEIKKGVKGAQRLVGTLSSIRVKKNRITGKKREPILLPIFPSYGIDDVSSCVEYLIKEKCWTKQGKVFVPKGMGEVIKPGTKEKLVKDIETLGKETKLRRLVGNRWKEIDEACAVKDRKSRY